MYPDCNEIKLAKMDKNPLRNNLYAIDPDGAGGVPLFPAYCDFKTNERIGITEVGVPLVFFSYIYGVIQINFDNTCTECITKFFNTKFCELF